MTTVTSLLFAVRKRLGLVALVLLAAPACPGLHGDSVSGALGEAPAYRFEPVGDGVYCALGTGTMAVGSNSAIIITTEGVVVVDSGGSPAAARSLIAELGAITRQPIRYLVNTHFHYDHTFGNEAFPSTVTIIGHDFTRATIASNPLNERSFLGFQSDLRVQIEQLRVQIASETDATKRHTLQTRLDLAEVNRQAVGAVTPRAPNLSFQNKLTLYLGGREIQILFVGRGHTGGDIVVFLPKEHIICTGDFYNGYIGYLGDAFVDEWADTLGELARLDFDTIIPGHGKPFRDRTKISQVQACLRDLWQQAAEFEARGVRAEEAARQIDLRRHAEPFPQFKNVGVPPLGVVRIYEILAQRRGLRPAVNPSASPIHAP